MTTRRFPQSIVRIAAAIVVAISSASAHADLQLSCPLRWDRIVKLAGSDLNADFYGKAVREWTKADLDQMLAWEYRCDAGTMPPTMRQVQLENVQRWYGQGVQALAQRDRLIASAAQRDAIGRSAAQNGLTQVSTPGTSPAEAEITLRFLPGSRLDYDQTRTCRTLADNPLRAVTPETLRQVQAFAEICVQARQMDPAAFEKIRQRVSRQTALYAAMSDFIRQVSQLGSEAAAQQGTDVQALEARHAQIAKEAQALGVIGWADEPVPGLESAEATLKTLQRTLANRACESAYDRAGMPAAWRSAQYLTDASQPDRLVDLVCLSVQSGATVHYLPKGMIGREGFAIESKQTRVRIYPEVERKNDGTLLLVPSSATINGESFEIRDRNSIHQLAAVLLMMLQTR